MFQSIRFPRYVPFSILFLLFITSIAQAQWDVEMTITSIEPMVEPVICFFGMNPAATDDFDEDLDVITDFPPPPVGIPYLISAFKGPGTLFFSKDIRANGPWMLVVNTDNEFVLSWDISSVPPDTPLFLNPGDGSPTINMREQDSQDFIAGIYVMSIDVEIDTMPPSPVTDFTASNPTEKTIDLTWVNPDEDFAGTLIVRSQDSIAWTPTMGTIYSVDEEVAQGVIVCFKGADDHSTKAFTDTGLSASTTYYYKAFAYDFSFNYSIGVEVSETALLVILSSLTATSSDDGVSLKWRTEAEVNNLGFNVYRSDKKDGKYTKVNPSLIKGTGTDGNPHDYSFTDENANVMEDSIYYYYIEDVDFSGKTNKSNTIEVKIKVDEQNIKTSTPPKPLKFALRQNYPNPFNPETWLPYELAKDATVTIYIYDVKGQLVRQLNIGEQKAGSYIVKDKSAYWNGRNSFGEKVASGVYFYTLQTGDFRATRRMVIMK